MSTLRVSSLPLPRRQKLALDSIHDAGGRRMREGGGGGGKEGRGGEGPRWTGDLCELIKYASDLSSLHPRGHPGGTYV